MIKRENAEEKEINRENEIKKYMLFNGSFWWRYFRWRNTGNRSRNIRNEGVINCDYVTADEV